MRYDEGLNLMFCTICEKHSKSKGPWVNGTNNFRLKSLHVHLKSAEHKQAVESVDPSQKSLSSTFAASQEKRNSAIVAALRTVYWIVKEEIANRKYKSLIEFQKLQGCKDIQNLYLGSNASYNSPDIFNQLLYALNNVVERQIESDIQKSPCLGVGIDESTDRSNEKHIAVVARYVDLEQAELVTTFLKCEKVKECTAQGIYSVTKEILSGKKIAMTKVCGLGTDGASVMTGHMNGVRALIHEDNPHCICIHCICHRLNLAVSQACQNIPEMQSLTAVISGVYNYISSSPRRAEQLKELNELLEQKNIKLKRIYEIRWLSMGDAVCAIIKNYEALLMLTSSEGLLGDPIAIGLNQQLSSFLILALIHLSADVLSVTNHLSRIFQHRDVCFSALREKLDDCVATLEALREKNGPLLSAMESELTEDPPGSFKGTTINYEAKRGQPGQNTLFQQIRLQFLNQLLENLRARFPKIALLTAMQIFEPASYPAESQLI